MSALEVASFVSNADGPERVCSGCGCSEFDPCLFDGGPFGTCYWEFDDLCSRCALRMPHRSHPPLVWVRVDPDTFRLASDPAYELRREHVFRIPRPEGVGEDGEMLWALHWLPTPALREFEAADDVHAYPMTACWPLAELFSVMEWATTRRMLCGTSWRPYR